MKGPVIGSRKIKVLKTNGELEERQLKISDLDLRVHNVKGSIIEKDVSCDSEFMLTHIREIGAALRNNTYSFLSEDVPITLFMNNAGGHGKNDVKEQYEQILKDEYNIEIEWQVPQSPETNMLDLGVWMSLQSMVEKAHRKNVMQHDELSKTVMGLL